MCSSVVHDGKCLHDVWGIIELRKLRKCLSDVDGIIKLRKLNRKFYIVNPKL